MSDEGVYIQLEVGDVIRPEDEWYGIGRVEGAPTAEDWGVHLYVQRAKERGASGVARVRGVGISARIEPQVEEQWGEEFEI